MFRVCQRVTYALFLAALSACASFGRGPTSTALPLGDDAWLDQYSAALHLAEGESAYRLVDQNRMSFSLRMDSAAAAQRTIDAQYYLWNHDLTGTLLASELLRAAERGVRVRVLIDDVASRGLDRQLALLDAHPNFEIRLFNPFHTRDSMVGNTLEFLLRFGQPNKRMHNKLWVVDGRVAYAGGRNIGDEYFGADQQFNFTDLGVLLLGAAVSDAQSDFDRYWNSNMVVPMKALRESDTRILERHAGILARRERDLRDPFALGVLGTDGPNPQAFATALDGNLLRGFGVRYIADPPDKTGPGQKLLGALSEALNSSKEELVLVSPYFVPRRKGVEALAALQRRGVVVHVLTNSLQATDVAAVHGGYAKRRRGLLKAGIQLYELKPEPGMATARDRIGGSSNASLHTKGAVVDSHLAFVGSFNLDPRSARINTENGIFIDDPAFAAQVRSHWVRASDPVRSYRLALRRVGLSWTHQQDGETVVLNHEPKVNLSSRLMAWLFRWLPLESQL
jgi:putative cardiolipin synthase